MNSIDSNLSAVAGDQCMKTTSSHHHCFMTKITFFFRYAASESFVDNDWRWDSTQRLWHLQLQSWLELRSFWWARIVVELQLFLLQQETQADCLLYMSSDQVSIWKQILLLKLAQTQRTIRLYFHLLSKAAFALRFFFFAVFVFFSFCN